MDGIILVLNKMRNLNLKPFIYILLGISGILWFLNITISNLNPREFFEFIKVLPNVATIDILLIALFVRWGWKWKIFKGWLVPFPNLNGTWQGCIKTTWRNSEPGQSLSPVLAILTIKQSFFKISCVVRTAEMTSHSYSECFRLQSDNQIRQLHFSYTSKPRTSVTDRSPIHDGSITFDIIGDPVFKLKGQYWTSRRTTGEVVLLYKEKRLLDELPEDLNIDEIPLN